MIINLALNQTGPSYCLPFPSAHSASDKQNSVFMDITKQAVDISKALSADISLEIKANRARAMQRHATIYATAFSPDGNYLVCGDSLGAMLRLAIT